MIHRVFDSNGQLRNSFQTARLAKSLLSTLGAYSCIVIDNSIAWEWHHSTPRDLRFQQVQSRVKAALAEIFRPTLTTTTPVTEQPKPEQTTMNQKKSATTCEVDGCTNAIASRAPRSLALAKMCTKHRRKFSDKTTRQLPQGVSSRIVALAELELRARYSLQLISKLGGIEKVKQILSIPKRQLNNLIKLNQR